MCRVCTGVHIPAHPPSTGSFYAQRQPLDRGGGSFSYAGPDREAVAGGGAFSPEKVHAGRGGEGEQAHISKGSMMKRVIGVLGLALAVGLSGQADAQTLKTVRDRGALHCGVSQGLPGFSSPDDKGNWTGLDVDFCRAVAAAIFNDPSK